MPGDSSVQRKFYWVIRSPRCPADNGWRGKPTLSLWFAVLPQLVRAYICHVTTPLNIRSDTKGPRNSILILLIEVGNESANQPVSGTPDSERIPLGRCARACPPPEHLCQDDRRCRVITYQHQPRSLVNQCRHVPIADLAAPTTTATTN